MPDDLLRLTDSYCLRLSTVREIRIDEERPQVTIVFHDGKHSCWGGEDIQEVIQALRRLPLAESLPQE